MIGTVSFERLVEVGPRIYDPDETVEHSVVDTRLKYMHLGSRRNDWILGLQNESAHPVHRSLCHECIFCCAVTCSQYFTCNLSRKLLVEVIERQI